MSSSITSFQMQNLASVKQALNVSILQKTMKQDAQSIDGVIRAMEKSVTPYKGQNIDMKL